jgi:DNA-directed RNA polymerase omega subunit
LTNKSQSSIIDFLIHESKIMARISSEKAALAVGRYDLVLIGARRARELLRGWKAQVPGNNGAVVTAIREVEHGKIGRGYLLKPQNLDRKERPPEQ